MNNKENHNYYKRKNIENTIEKRERNDDYLKDFCDIYWRYKNLDTTTEEFCILLVNDSRFVIEVNKRALMGFPPSVEIIKGYPEEIEELYKNYSKYFINPFIGSLAAYIVKYHPKSQHLQNNKIIKNTILGNNMPQNVMTFRK